MTTTLIEPNRKYRTGHLEISCYGREMIIVSHPEVTLPIGPTDPEAFWEKPPGERLLTICDYLDAKMWAESSPDVLVHLGRDISAARKEAEAVLSDSETDEGATDE